MPPLGEVPITSYFQVNPSSRKRKSQGSSALPNKKGKVSALQSSKKLLASLPPTSKPTQEGRYALDVPEPLTPTARQNENKSLGRRKTMSPPAPPTAGQSENKDTRLLKTRRRISRAKSGDDSDGESHQGSESLSLTAPSLPPHATPDSRSPSSRNDVSLPDETDATQAPGFSIPCSGATYDELIPSSQSQFTLLPPNPLPVFTAVEGASRCRNATSTLFDLLETTDSQTVVMSSQTQLLGDFVHTSSAGLPPRTWEPNHTEVIPSSQSQEQELVFPSVELSENSDHLKVPVRGNKNVHLKTTSVYLTPAVSAKSLFDEIFEAVHPAEKPLLSPKQDEELSLTESDSEAERLGLRSEEQFRHLPSAAPEVAEHPAHSAPRVRRPVSSLDRDSRDGESLPAEFSQEDSLPPVIKDFQAMFGDAEDSFPPDFPMSLR